MGGLIPGFRKIKVFNTSSLSVILSLIRVALVLRHLKNYRRETIFLALVRRFPSIMLERGNGLKWRLAPGKIYALFHIVLDFIQNLGYTLFYFNRPILRLGFRYYHAIQQDHFESCSRHCPWSIEGRQLRCHLQFPYCCRDLL